MEEMVLEAKEEFNKIIEFATRDALTWELHSVEGELFRRLLKMGLVLAHLPNQRVARDLTPVVDEFSDSLEEPKSEEEGPILIETLDGKGILMCKADPDQPKTADKPGKEKMALVTATMSADP